MSLSKIQLTLNVEADGIMGKNTARAIAEKYSLNKFEGANFLGQLHVETGGFKKFTESMAYTQERMLEIFKKDFDTNKNGKIEDSERTKARLLEGNHEAIANFVYANQNGNGPESSGDGWKFRGRGPVHLTGRYNYQRFADYAKDQEIMNNPELINEKYAMESAFWFFEERNIFDYAKSSISNKTITQVTKLVNGGKNGLSERINATQKYYLML